MSALCALALSLIAYAHTPGWAAATIPTPLLGPFLALGGTLEDLCLTGDAGEHAQRLQTCPACIISKTMVPAPGTPEAFRQSAWTAGPDVPTRHARVLRGRARVPPGRGPPPAG
jgi:hypothetical protein